MRVCERWVCRLLWQHRSTLRKTPPRADDEAALTEAIIVLARQYGRYGYRWIMAFVRAAGWHVSFKSVECIWCREGLNVPQRQPKRSRLWFMTDRASDCSRNIRVLGRMPSNSTWAQAALSNQPVTALPSPASTS